MTRCTAILLMFLIAACAHSPGRALKADAAALVQASGSQKTYADFVDQLTAYRELMERQRVFSYRAGCKFEQERSYDCMSEKQQAAYNKLHPDSLDQVTVTGSLIRAADAITNNQESGVDEGALLKKSGNFLFLLEDATLHSIRIERDGQPVLERVSSVVLDANWATSDVWYDEILVLDGQLLVLGFNHEEEVAELHSYQIDPYGGLQPNAKYWLRSGDYFSSSGYASRIHQGKLVTRMTVEIDTDDKSADFQWPEWSRRDVANPSWQLMVDTPNLSYALGALDEWMGIHVVLQCELDSLARGSFDCRNQAVVGPLAATFYVSANAAYLSFIHMSAEAFGDPKFDLSYGGPKWAKNALQVARTTIARLDLLGSQPPMFAQIQGRVDDSLALSEREQSLFVLSQHFSWRNSTTIPMLNRLLPTDWSPQRAYLIDPITRLPNFRWLDRYRYGADALWLSERDGSDENASVALHKQPLAGGAASRYPIEHDATLMQALPAGMLVIGDASGGMGATMLLDAAPMNTNPKTFWPTRAVAESRSQAVNLQFQPDGSVLIGWPSIKKLPDEDPQDQPSDLQFIELSSNQIRDIGEVNMQDISPPTDQQEIAWYGDARIAFVGTRVFTFSRNLVKEAAYQNGVMSVQRRLDLAAKD